MKEIATVWDGREDVSALILEYPGRKVIIPYFTLKKLEDLVHKQSNLIVLESEWHYK